MIKSHNVSNISEEVLARSIISAVNASEVIAELQKIKIFAQEAQKMIETVVQEVIPFDFEQAACAAALDAQQFGLPFGARPCLTLGKLSSIHRRKNLEKLKSSIKVTLI